MPLSLLTMMRNVMKNQGRKTARTAVATTAARQSGLHMKSGAAALKAGKAVQGASLNGVALRILAAFLLVNPRLAGAGGGSLPAWRRG